MGVVASRKERNGPHLSATFNAHVDPSFAVYRASRCPGQAQRLAACADARHSSDPNGLVTVRADANGSLTGIELSPRIQRTSPNRSERHRRPDGGGDEGAAIVVTSTHHHVRGEGLGRSASACRLPGRLLEYEDPLAVSYGINWGTAVCNRLVPWV
jgi:hypothetical protein